jgi:hypothetical protein
VSISGGIYRELTNISYLRGVCEESFNQDLYSEFEGHETALIHYLADVLALFCAL